MTTKHIKDEGISDIVVDAGFFITETSFSTRSTGAKKQSNRKRYQVNGGSKAIANKDENIVAKLISDVNNIKNVVSVSTAIRTPVSLVIDPSCHIFDTSCRLSSPATMAMRQKQLVANCILSKTA